MAFTESFEYRYYLTDLLSNQLISEVPFRGVSFARANRRAGEFSGKIPFIEATKGLDLYEATMPGRTGLYITRNSVVVWGGIIWARSYNVDSQELDVSGAEFISYLYHRNIWQTLIYGSEYVGVFSYSVNNGVGTITTEIPHGLSVGQFVGITFTNPAVDGNRQITRINSANSFSFSTEAGDVGTNRSTSGAIRLLIDTYDFARDLVFQMSTDHAGLNFANEVIKPGIEKQGSVITKERTNGVVTLKTSSDHTVIPGQEVEVQEVGSGLDGVHRVTEVPDRRTIKYNLSGPNVSRSSLSGIRVLNVATKQISNGVVTLTTDINHGASVGQTVFVDKIDSFFSDRLDTTYNGRWTISGTPSGNTLQYVNEAILPDGPESGNGGTVSLGSKFIYGDYGGFTANSDIGIGFQDFRKSGKYQDTQFLRGFELKTYGEVLEQYSTNVDGFEYRIDCDYDFDTASFTRTFTIIDSEPAEPPPPGELYPVTTLGANNYVFEFPGNVITFSVDESAEESATRFFVGGNIEDLNDAASQPYAGASDSELLDSFSGRSWPLLDQVEILNEVEAEGTLYQYATDYLYESKPPMGTFTLSVNGSIDPVVGSYYPGDWCSIIIDDEFVRQRLANDQEPRDDLIIRKIEGYKVTVPDSPTSPEKVELTLVTDWKVDQVGN